MRRHTWMTERHGDVSILGNDTHALRARCFMTKNALADCSSSFN
jgi:hypothetical protein